MINIRLARIGSHPEEGVFGVLVLSGRPICVTLEPYHRDNNQNISCIPTGNYICQKVKSLRYGVTFHIKEISGRTDVLFHSGNRDNDSRGCVILGEEFGTLFGDWAVMGSKRAHNEFMKRLEEEKEFMLTITEAY